MDQEIIKVLKYHALFDIDNILVWSNTSFTTIQ